MSLRFIVHRATRIGGVTAVDGVLAEGNLKHNIRVTAHTRSGAFPVLIKTVAFVDPPDASSTLRTLTVDAGGIPLAVLEGAVLTEDVARNGASEVTSIRYESGNENDPIDPGRTVVDVEASGNVLLSFEKPGRKLRWTAKQEPALWPALLAALAAAGFPTPPPSRTVPADTVGYAITVKGGNSVQRVSLPPCREYAAVSKLFIAIVAQISGDQVLGFTLPTETPYVRDVVPATDETIPARG